MDFVQIGLGRLRVAVQRLAVSLTRSQKRAVLLLLDSQLAVLVAGCSALSLGLPFPTAAGLGLAAILGAVASHLGGLSRIKLGAFALRGLGPFAFAAAGTGAALALAGGAPLSGRGAAAVAVFAFAFVAAAVAQRLTLRGLLRWAARQGHRRPVLIWGAGETGARLAAALHADPAIAAAAFIDPDPALQGLRVAGLAVHPPEGIAALAKATGADRVLLAVPEQSARRQAEIAAGLAAAGIEVMAVPSFAQIAGETAPGASLLPVAAARVLGRSAACPELSAAAPVYRGAAVMVTGAGGSVGAELCRQLIGMRPRRIVLFDLSEAALYAIDAELHARDDIAGIEIVSAIGSVTDGPACARLIRRHGVGIVLHAAAYKHVPLVEGSPLAGLTTNVLGTRCLAEVALQGGVERFVFVSTDKAVRPVGVMGLSKRLAECALQDLARVPSAAALAIVRFGNVLDSSGSVVPRFRQQIARGGPVTLTHEDATRYFMTLAEAARLVLLAGATAAPGKAEIFALDMGAPIRIRDLAERMIAAAGRSLLGPDNPTGEIAIRVTGLRPGEKLHEELLIAGRTEPTDHPRVLRLCEPPALPAALPGVLAALRAAALTGDSAAALGAARACLAGEAGAPAPGTAPRHLATTPARLSA